MKTEPKYICSLCGRRIKSFDLYTTSYRRGEHVRTVPIPKTVIVCKGGCPE